MADDTSQKRAGRPPTHLLKVKERNGNGKSTIGVGWLNKDGSPRIRPVGSLWGCTMIERQPYREIVCTASAPPARCAQDANRPVAKLTNTNGPWWYRHGFPPPELCVVMVILATMTAACGIATYLDAERIAAQPPSVLPDERLQYDRWHQRPGGGVMYRLDTESSGGLADDHSCRQ